MGIAKPYVYICRHKPNNRFYIGYRFANIFPADDDLGIHYFTSCLEVRNNFHEYTYEVLSEYPSQEWAYEVEQRVIYENRKDMNLINKNYKTSNMMELSPTPVIKKPKVTVSKSNINMPTVVQAKLTEAEQLKILLEEYVKPTNASCSSRISELIGKVKHRIKKYKKKAENKLVK